MDFLEQVSSQLISDCPTTIAEIRTRVQHETDTIRKTGTLEEKELIEFHMSKLLSCDIINTTVEGIVFVFKGQTYKLTGVFPHLNSILGLRRYV